MATDGVNVTAPPSDLALGDEPTLPPTSMDLTLSGKELGTSCAIYGALGLVVMITYLVLAHCAPIKYAPRRLFVDAERQVERPRRVLQWLRLLLHPRRADEIVLRNVGLDAYATLRFLGLALKLFSALVPLGLLVLAPVYATQGSMRNLNNSSAFSPIDVMTINYVVGPDTPRSLLWLPCLFVFLFTGVGLWLVHHEYKNMIALQREFYLYRHAATYTVLVERVPPGISSRRALERYFETIFPDTVERVDLVPKSATATELQAAVDDREEIVARLERALLDEYVHNGGDSDKPGAWHARELEFPPGKRWMGLRGFCYGRLWPCFGEEKEVVPFLRERLADLNERVSVLQDALHREMYEPGREYPPPEEVEGGAEALSGSEGGAGSAATFDEADWLLGDHPKHLGDETADNAAFVTFKTKTASSVTGRCMTADSNNFLVRPAPEPAEINWARVSLHPTVVLGARIGVMLINLVLLLSFGVLTSTISATTNLASIRSGWEGLDNFLLDNPWAVPLMDQIAPLLLVIAFALVPPVLNLILTLRFQLSDSARENSFFLNYSAFLVLQLFLFFQISGAIFTVLAQSWQNPRELIQLLAATVPNNAIFFMQFIVIRTFWVLPAELLRVSDMLLCFIVRPIFCGRARTPRELRDDQCGCRTFSHAGDAWHGMINAQFLLILTIAVTYSVIAPLLLVFALMFFAMALPIYRNQLLFVYVKSYESGAANWPNIATLVLLAFALLHLTMLGIFALAEAVLQSVFMVVPFIATCAYAAFLRTSYEHGSQHVSLADARRFDLRRMANAAKHVPHDYAHPVLRAPKHVEPREVANMLRELETLSEAPEPEAGAQQKVSGEDDSPSGADEEASRKGSTAGAATAPSGQGEDQPLIID